MRAASKVIAIAIVNGIAAPAGLNRFMWYQHCLSVCTVAHLSGRFDQKVLSAQQWHATVAAKTPCPGEDNKDCLQVLLEGDSYWWSIISFGTTTNDCRAS